MLIAVQVINGVQHGAALVVAAKSPTALKWTVPGVGAAETLVPRTSRKTDKTLTSNPPDAP
jgi:hypothetical protein